MTEQHWNYRVIEFDDDGELTRSIHEVYYDENRKPCSYMDAPAVVVWEPAEDKGPYWILEAMRKALELPVLRPQDFPNSPHSVHDDEAAI